MAKKESAPLVTMDDVFQALSAIEEEHGVRAGLLLFPVQDPSMGAKFGLSVRAYDSTGKVIRDLVCSHTYWPSAKYTSWEAGALDCVTTLAKEIEETYVPLLSLLAGYVAGDKS